MIKLKFSSHLFQNYLSTPCNKIDIERWIDMVFFVFFMTTLLFLMTIYDIIPRLIISLYSISPKLSQFVFSIQQESRCISNYLNDFSVGKWHTSKKTQLRSMKPAVTWKNNNCSIICTLAFPGTCKWKDQAMLYFLNDIYFFKFWNSLPQDFVDAERL